VRDAAVRFNHRRVNPLAIRALFLAAIVAVCCPAAEFSVRSDYLIVRCDIASSRLTLTRATREPLLGDIVLPGGPIIGASTNSAVHPVFGRGRQLEIVHAGGVRQAIMVFPDVPFALFGSSLSNGTSQAIVTNRIETLAGAIGFGPGASALKTFGTGGLLPPGQNPGSYAWMAVVEPVRRNGLVFGWLTGDRGSGVLFSSVQEDVAHVSARLDYGRLRIAPGKTEPLESLVIGYFEDCRLGLEQWADAVAKHYSIHLPPQPTGYCTWYSRPHGGASDEAHLVELAEFARTNLAPYGFSVVQIDDHWQAGISTNGPKRNFTTHQAGGPYPRGMKLPADKLRSLGLVAGLWFMPFAGTYYDPFFASHEDWFVKRADDGRPYETAWGGTCLDMTVPGAREHLSNVVHRITHDWGYHYLKIDGLWTGTATRQQYVNSGYREDNMGDAVLHDPDKTNIEEFRDGLRLLRHAAGTNVFVLGCNGPQNMRSYQGAFGLVDGMRVGPDNGPGWKSLLRGPTFGSRHYFLQGRIWYNDPDPVYVRAEMPLNHARLICSWVALSGQLNLSSDWLPGLPAERLDILKRTMPPHGAKARPADLFDNDPPRIWVVSDAGRAGRRDVVGLFNWSDKEATIAMPLGRLGIDPFLEFDAFDYWENTLLPSVKGELRLSVPAQSCRVLALRIHAPHPQVISTSRHVTQGMLDVLTERWNETTKTLSGHSRVVAGDPYELRITGAPAGATVAVENSQARISSKTDGALLRATITSPVTGEVGWQIR